MRSRRELGLSSGALCIAVLLGILIVGVARAGEYEIVDGKGQELCEVCRQNLVQMTEHPACERTYSSTLGLSAPEWKPFDVLGNLGAMKQVMKFLRTGNEFAKDDYVMGEEQYELYVRRIIGDRLQQVSMTLADIDNDGRLDNVLRWAGGPCNQRGEGGSGAYSSPIVVLKKDHSGIDRAKTDLVVQNPERAVRMPGDTTYQMYSVFSFKGKTYFDRWNDTVIYGESHRFTLTVYEAQGGKTRKRCQLKEVQ